MTTAASTPSIFISRAIPDAGIDLIRAVASVDVWPGPLGPPRDELLRQVAGRHGVLLLPSERVDDELLDAAGPSLRVISTFSVGYEHIDVAACLRHGVAAGHTPGVLTETTADTAWSLLMAGARRIAEADRYVRAGRWPGGAIDDLIGVDIHGAKLGIVGFGRIGQAVARRSMGFGMTVVYHSRNRVSADVEAELGARWLPLDELLAEADFVSVHAPLGTDTHHLIDAAALARMKPTAVLINTARGGLVDTDALLAALDSGSIRAAALDVTDPEPLPADHPLVGRDDCVIIPHIGSATVATRNVMSTMAAENLLAGLNGEALPHAIPGSVPA
jgi:lactate dehydrogenase-like 2-hydroxyacid dehydrogenase